MFFVTLAFLQKCVLQIEVSMSDGGVWRRMGAHGSVTDAYECIWMQSDACAAMLGFVDDAGRTYCPYHEKHGVAPGYSRKC